jgi:hypothetical protein
MAPKDVLTLLQIIDLSSQTPTYSHITGAAHEALLHAQLVALKAGEEGEEHGNPTSKKSKAKEE